MVALAVVVLCILSLMKFTMAGYVYNVVDYHAVGDGKTDDTQAFLKAWHAVCNDAWSPMMLIPSRRNFLLKEILLEGLCSGKITIQVDGNITAPGYFWTTEMTNLITFHAIGNLTVRGSGTIDGKGAIWWNRFKKTGGSRPYILEFINCQNLAVSDLHMRNSPSKHLAFDGCNNLTITAIRIRAPGNSPNTDGIVMLHCHNVQVTQCRIGTGDDCIAVLTDSSDVDISRIICGPGHGLSIGSLGEGNSEAAVERIHVHDSVIYQALTGLRIKTWKGGSGYARDITFERIKMAHLATPIVIDQSYGTLELGDVAISNVAFRHIYGTSMNEVAVKIQCSGYVPCKDLTFDDIVLYRAGTNHTVLALTQNAYGTTNGKSVPVIPWRVDPKDSDPFDGFFSYYMLFPLNFC